MGKQKRPASAVLESPKIKTHAKEATGIDTQPLKVAGQHLTRQVEQGRLPGYMSYVLKVGWDGVLAGHGIVQTRQLWTVDPGRSSGFSWVCAAIFHAPTSRILEHDGTCTAFALGRPDDAFWGLWACRLSRWTNDAIGDCFACTPRRDLADPRNSGRRLQTWPVGSWLPSRAASEISVFLWSTVWTLDKPGPLCVVRKPFLVVGFLILYERGIVDLHDPISKFLPEFEAAVVGPKRCDCGAVLCYAIGSGLCDWQFWWLVSSRNQELDRLNLKPPVLLMISI